MTTYYPDSKGITKADIGAVSDYMEKIGLLVVSPMCFINTESLVLIGC